MRKKRGFTLVEVMVSVAILGVGLALIANSYIIAARGLNSSANNIAALNLAQEKLQALEISSLKQGLSASITQDVLKSASKNYNYTQEITEISEPLDLAKNFVQACASISWQEQNNTKNVTLSTFLPKKKQ